ncbi:MAG: carboxypeptidase M32 [Candidatus Thorarchaeota archaeon]|nr:carboxypeptidase M32 [Candidatus Thorarchaeota archaeon]
MSAYDDFLARARELVTVESATGVLYWDLETYMPPKGIRLRSEQIAALSKIQHEMLTSPETGKLLEAAEKEMGSYDEVQKRNLHLARREYDSETKVPVDLVMAIARQQAITTDVWKKAKAAQDWKKFQPELKKMIDLTRQRYEIIMDVKGIPVLYDAMVDDYERAMTSAKIEKVFSELRDGLIPLAQKCADATKGTDLSRLARPVPVEIQRKIATDLANLIGYDTTSKEAGGRIDETEHPFTTGYFDDVRITVHYHEKNVMSMIYAILHEGGHALYEQNLNHDWMYQPIGKAASMGIHESMSRFVENIFGRTNEFWQFYYPRLNELTNNTFADIPLDEFVRAVNHVRPSKIRIEADEVTYSLHIIIRFEIERDLFGGKLDVSDLPQVWNEKYEKYLGIEIKNDSEGVMQDTHWASGLFGYFPSYALGNVYDGMWRDKINHDIPDWQTRIPSGEFAHIKSWLVENIHSKSALYDPADLVKHVTGKDLEAKPFLRYLEEKYSNLFGF